MREPCVQGGGVLQRLDLSTTPENNQPSISAVLLFCSLCNNSG